MPYAPSVRSSLLIITAAGLAACPGDDPVDPMDPCAEVDSSITIVPPPTGEMCPWAPNGVGPVGSGVLMGDREFAGNGPLITIDVDAAINPSATSVVATIVYSAAEIGGDTVITQQFMRTLYNAPAGSTIVSIDSPTSSHIEAESPDGGFEFIICEDGPQVPAADIMITGGLVSSVQMIGDTGGPDVSDDFNCACDTRVDNLSFNQVTVTLNTQPTDPICFGGETSTETTGPSPLPCGENCEVDEDCLSGSCEGGLCGSTCESDEPCNVPGAQGVCGPGLTECNGCETQCFSVTEASDEICDGLDNDCDGSTDESLGGADCTVTPDPCEIEVPGQTVCSGGSETCVPETYCEICGGECGDCIACIPGVSVCPPNFQCLGPLGGATCQFNDTCPNPTPSCWLPSDLEMVGNCAD